MVSFLKKLKELAPTGSPKYLLHKHLGGYNPGRPIKKVHASELTKSEGFCPRFYALSDAVKAKTPDEWLTTSEEQTFQMGRDLQDNVAHWFADMNLAIGHWKCLACGKLHEFQARPVKCKECYCKGFHHEEVRFTSSTNGASCGVDLLLKLGKPKLTPIEIKSIDKDQFKSLATALAEHRQRSNLYLRIIDEAEEHYGSLVHTGEICILYVSKGGYGCADPQLSKWGINEKFSPYKEFFIKRDDSKTDEEHKRAKVVKDFREGHVGMPCGICSTALAKRAVYCARKKECFSGEFPAKYDWKTDD